MEVEDYGFCGGGYTPQSSIADPNLLMNLYTEIIQDPFSQKTRRILLSTPGTSVFANAGSGPIRGALLWNGLLYVVSRNEVYSITSAAVVTQMTGTVAYATNSPVSMSASDDQMLIISVGLGYILSSSTVTQIADGDFPASVLDGAYVDGYFLVVTSASCFFSAVDNGTSWDALDFFTVQASQSALVGIRVINQEPWIFCGEVVQPFSNTGATDIPFEPIRSATIPHGCAAAASIGEMNGNAVWLMSDAQGSNSVIRAVGYDAQRVSNHAVEFALSGYTTISDAVAYVYQDQGHTFYVLSFPDADATHVYDETTNEWHQRSYRNPSTGILGAHISINHQFCFGKHLVGSRSGRAIYELKLPTQAADATVTFGDDGGDILLRRRRCALPWTFGKRVFVDCLTFLVEPGLGTPSGQGLTPTLMVRMSFDGGKTWGNERTVSAGAMSAFAGYFPRLWRWGSGMQPVVEVSMTDPIPWRFLGATAVLEAEP